MKTGAFFRFSLWLFSHRLCMSSPCTRVDLYACELSGQYEVWFIFMHAYAFIFGHIGWFLLILLVHMANGWCTERLVRSVVRQTQRSSPCVSMLLPPSLSRSLSPSLPLFSSGIPHPPSLYVLPYSLKNQPEEETFTLAENRLTLSNQKIAYNRDHRLDQGDLS